MYYNYSNLEHELKIHRRSSEQVGNLEINKKMVGFRYEVEIEIKWVLNNKFIPWVFSNFIAE